MANFVNNLQLPGFVLSILVTLQVEASDQGDNLGGLFGNEAMLSSIATGHPLPQNLSPSVTSVLTSRDIEKIGARRLDEVLEYLPGIHISTARGGANVIGFRGIYSEANAQVLVLVNGIPLRDIAIAGKPLAWNMPVKNISHIEIIRGPGSMLYGGDATTGVINVITKTGREIKNVKAGGFFGSQDTYEGWTQYGSKEGDWEYAISLQGGTSHGSQGRVERDTQSFLDQQFGSRASKAPGFTNNGRNDIDARIDIGFKDWLRFRAGYQRFGDVQTNQGIALALDNWGSSTVDLYNTDLTFTDNLTDEFKNTSKLYFIGQESQADHRLLPPNTFGGLLPQGAISQPQNFQGSTGITTQFDYTGIKKHNLSLGIGLAYSWVTDVSNKLNFLITPTFIQQIPPTEVSQIGGATLTSLNRTNFYTLFQDEWIIEPDFFLTTGLRYDYYSDTTDGFSPRISLVWNANSNLTAKLHYSRSFRPPSFLEKDIGSAGGKTIKPETVNTVEFQIENRWSPWLITSANAYWFEFNNLITSASDSTLTSLAAISPNPVAFSNVAKINGAGLESELRYAFNDELSLTVNYSYHGVSNRNQTGLLPEHMIKGLVDWEFAEDWRIGIQLNWIGERRRPANDPRPNLDDYFIVGLTLRTKIMDPLDFTLRANNLFGTNAKEPSLNPILLPGDVPVTDRSILGQFTWSY